MSPVRAAKPAECPDVVRREAFRWSHGGRGGRRTSGQNVTDVAEQERFAPGYENLANTECGCFAGDPSHSLRAERASRCLR